MNLQMDYRQAEDYILSFTDYEKIPGIAYTSANYDLRRMEKLLQPLGNPHLGAKTVHIAGTKGKGSTAAMIYQTLIAAGYKTGLFTSPHLHTLRERIRINGTFISEAEFAALITELKPIVEAVNREAAYGELTTFEILTVAVFAHFNKNHVDFQVLEVGLGGRLDATNVAKGDVCIITSISLDHIEILGDTIAKIAAEKAGIIKPGCTVVSAPQTREAAKIIEQVCHQQQARLIQVGKDVTWHKTGGDLSHQILTVQGKNGNYNLTIPLLGDHQLENATTAVAALEALAFLGTKISHKNIIQGLSQVNWPGRLQILSHEPMVVVDGAHNDYSMKRLVEAVKKYFDYDRCFIIFGTSCDKDISGMVRELKPLGDHIIITSSSHPRAASTLILSDKFAKLGVKVKIAESVPDALSQALASTGKTGLILVTGSLFVVAEAIDYTSRAGTADVNQRNR
ncbi:MAG: bifunctional folylpolyglutamate synthase/dihydrofolate synthase [Chloroflexi bacterium]|nr:bifunctional folylpolyglutamate synthase/dihydrofolate synthase [Chloroflexota bacterium]